MKAPPVLEPEPELLGYESDAPSASSSNPPLDDGAGDEAKDPAADTRSVASGGKSGKGGKQAGTGGGKQTVKKGDAKVGGTKVGSAKAGGAKADGVKTGGKGGRAKGEAGKGASKGASGAGGASGAMGKVKAKAKTTLVSQSTQLTTDRLMHIRLVGQRNTRFGGESWYIKRSRSLNSKQEEVEG